MEHLLGPQEVADYLHVPVRTVYAWRQRGTGPRGFRVGRHVRYRLEDVDAWLETQADKEDANDAA
jgi:excisionase family DNA binding protein